MKSGIRLSVWFDHALDEQDRPLVHDAELTFEGEVVPGSQSTARLTPLQPELWPDVGVGSHHDLWEGSTVGSWIEIIEPLKPGD
jgi:hypothetical protein